MCVQKSKNVNVTFSSAFSSRYAKTQTSNFHKVVWQHTEGMVATYCGNILKVWWEVSYAFHWLFSSERI